MQLARSLSRRPKLESRSDNVGPHFPSHDLTDPNGKHRRQNFILTDSSRPLSSTRAFSHPVCVAVCAQGWPCRLWAAAYTLGSECRTGCGRRRAAAGRLQRPPKSQFCRFCWKVAFSGAGGRRVCAASGLFDVGPCPTLPGVCAGRVPRGVARRGTGGRPEQPPKRGFSRPTLRAAE